MCEMSQDYRESNRYGIAIRKYNLWKNHYSCLKFCKSRLSYQNTYGVMANYFAGELFCKCNQKARYGRPNTEYSQDFREWIFNDFRVHPSSQRIKSKSCRIESKFLVFNPSSIFEGGFITSLVVF